jgi:intracellular sulfur oxidation DsrE/DsrF family protein
MARIVLALALTLLAPFCHADAKTDPVGPDKVVYHLNAGLAQAAAGLEYVRNHLEANPKAQIVVVTHAAGVDFLMKGAKSARGNPFAQAVEDLQLQGVRFRVCEITLRERGLRREQFIPEMEFVRSGVAEVARLQQREGYAYLRP